MRKLNLVAVIALFSLASCTAYHISTVNSTNLTKNEATGKFVRENDSLKVTYSFSGFNAPVTIQIFNKLDKPMYIDWQRSAAIVNDMAESYAGRRLAIEGNINAESYRTHTGLWNETSASGSINAVAELPKNVSFIPPHSAINNTAVNLVDNANNYAWQPEGGAQRFSYSSTTDGGTLRVKTADFSQNDSPLKFKSYLTLYINEGQSPKTLVFLDDFYVSKSMKVLVSPVKLQEMQGSRGDLFYTLK